MRYDRNGVPKHRKNKRMSKSGVGCLIVTIVFATAATVLLILAYTNEIIKWLAGPGIALAVCALIPLGFIGYQALNRKLDN